MKEQITVYYNKDRKHPEDYIVKRVLLQEGENYSINSYYMIKGKIKDYPSKLKLTGEKVNQYILQCMRADFFDRIEYQSVMEGI